MTPGWQDVAPMLPAIVLIVGGCLLLLLEVGSRGTSRGHLAWLTVLIATVAGWFAWGEPAARLSLFGGAAVADGFGTFITLAICVALGLSALAASGYLHNRGIERGEFYGLTCLSASGMVFLAMSTDLLTMFVSIEVMSIATYALVAFRRDSPRSAEAALKYLLLGALSSAIFLYGAALLYTATGALSFEQIARSAAVNGVTPLFLVGMALATVGFAFKVSAVPFHMWTPDVYEGAPTPVTAFMAAGVKTAAFAALVRLLLTALGSSELATGDAGWGPIVYGLAMLTMVVGNLLAIVQDNVKRILAYSSIAHAGYTLLALTAAAWGGPQLTSSVLVYLFVYGVTAVGAFAVIGAIERRTAQGESTGHIDELAGLATRHPGLAFAMTIFMFSLAGVPPTGGFIAKLEVFRALFAAASGAGDWSRALIVLGVVGVLSSAVGVYYYLRVVVWMYMRPAREDLDTTVPNTSTRIGIAVAAAAVLALGVMPGPLSRLAQQSVKSSFGPAPTAAVHGDTGRG